jgi:hypothetical protein
MSGSRGVDAVDSGCMSGPPFRNTSNVAIPSGKLRVRRAFALSLNADDNPTKFSHPKNLLELLIRGGGRNRPFMLLIAIEL